MVKRKKRAKKLKSVKVLSDLSDLGREVRHRSRIVFSQHKVVGRVIESKKMKPVKHRLRQQQAWEDE